MRFLLLIELPEKQEQLLAIYKVLEELPTANFNTLERLIFHLVRSDSLYCVLWPCIFVCIIIYHEHSLVVTCILRGPLCPKCVLFLVNTAPLTCFTPGHLLTASTLEYIYFMCF